MSGFDDSETTRIDRLRNAYEIARRREFCLAKRICIEALEEFHREGLTEEISEACHLLGQICQLEGEFESAASWYRKSLEIDECQGNCETIGFARTCNNLSSVLTRAGEFNEAEELLWKSIGIKERFGDRSGTAASYHQLGVTAEYRSTFEAAEAWFLESLRIEEETGNVRGMVETMLRLARLCSTTDRTGPADSWFKRALELIEDEVDPHWAFGIADEAERSGGYTVPKKIYWKAVGATRIVADDLGLSFRLGRRAYQCGDLVSASDFFKASVKVSKSSSDRNRLADSYYMLGKAYIVPCKDASRSFRKARACFSLSLASTQDPSWFERIRVLMFICYCRLRSRWGQPPNGRG